MRTLTTTSRFDRMLVKFVRAYPDLREATISLMKNLVVSLYDSKLKTCSLGGRLKGALGASIGLKYRVVFLLFN